VNIGHAALKSRFMKLFHHTSIATDTGLQIAIIFHFVIQHLTAIKRRKLK